MCYRLRLIITTNNYRFIIWLWACESGDTSVGVEARCKELNILNMASGNESAVITPIEATDDDDDDDVGWELPVTVASYYHPTHPSFDLSEDVGRKYDSIRTIITL